MPDDSRLLQLAFTVHMAEQILGSDLDVADAEASWLHETFPTPMMRSIGFLDDQGNRTARFEEARDVALLELPTLLSDVDKLQVMELLVAAAAADGVLAAEESMALAHAAQLLGLAHDEWAQHLQEMLSSGHLTRDSSGV